MVAELPVYHTYKTKIDCPDSEKAGIMERFKAAMSDEGKVDDTDGLKVYCEDGWTLTRPSGTDPIIRVYAESKDGISWERKDDKVGIDVSESGWDSEMICYPFVFEHKGQKYLLYNGNGYGKTGLGYAVLEEG